MNHSIPRRVSPLHRLALAVAIVVPIVTASCSVAPPSPSAGRTEPGPAATGTPSPEPTATTVPTATAGPSATATPSAPSVEPAATPPAASLAAEGGDPVVGQLGSYTWGGGGSDSPWLQGAPLPVGAREPLTVTLAGDPPVSRWSARRTRAGATDPIGALAAGSGTGPIAIDAPASGSWTLAVTVTFAGGLGSATWYWRLDVR